MVITQASLCHLLPHRTLIDRLNRPSLQEERTVLGAKVSGPLLQAPQPRPQMRPPLLPSPGAPMRLTISLVNRQRVVSTTRQTTVASMVARSRAATTVQQAEMLISRARERLCGCNLADEWRKFAKSIGNGLAFVECIYYWERCWG